jgi:hypothetical protein
MASWRWIIKGFIEVGSQQKAVGKIQNICQLPIVDRQLKVC